MGYRLKVDKVVCIGLDLELGEPNEAMVVDMSGQEIDEETKQLSLKLLGPVVEQDMHHLF